MGEEAAGVGLRELGAEVIDVEISTAKAMRADERKVETTVMQYEFKAGIDSYLAGRPGIRPRSLADLIRFNQEHAADEMPYFRQEIFEACQSRSGLDSADYLSALAESRRLSREDGIDPTLNKYRLEALVAPSLPPSWGTAQINADPTLARSPTPP